MSGEKRSQDQEDTLLEETTIIVDIEGTTSSIGFVKDTLFPYVRENLKQYIEKNWEVEEFKADLAKLKEQANKDETDKVEGVVSITGATPEEERETVLKNVLWQMDGDRKTGALKQLQGHIWREGYKSGAIKGHVYEDVPKAFDSWTKSGRKIYVYSSGSVEAQKLLFGHSEHGDMLKYFTGYFDTEVGPKQEASSYKKILEKIDAVPSSVLFLTDIVKEAQAAKEAGVSAHIVVRPGNAPLTDEEKVTFTTIDSFTDLSFQTSSKRQKVDKPEEKEQSKPSEPEAPACEPMDTTDDAPAPIEKISEKVVEKVVVDDSKKSVESEKIETKTTTTSKSEVTTMEIDNKSETEKKSSATVEKVAIVEEMKKIEEESKTKENKETTKEAVSGETVNNKDVKVAKDETEKAKPEIKASKDEAKLTNEKSEEVKKESETSKTENCKIESEPMDEAKNESSSSKSEPIATITEEKTEPPTKITESGKSERKIETETETKPAVSVPEEKPKETPAAPSSAAEDTSKASVETKADEKSEEQKIEKISVPEDTPKVAVAKSEDKPAVATEVKQNGGNVAGKSDECTASKVELNGAANEETPKKDETVAETKTTTMTKEPEEKSETVVETAKKEDKEIEQSKSEIETVVGETVDAKLNGNAQNGKESTTVTDDKPHRNGLNGDSSNDKSNGDAKNETTAQNGDPESTSEAASTAESIKVKKLVDSTIADGAGEPDVLPPVAVAATS